MVRTIALLILAASGISHAADPIQIIGVVNSASFQPGMPSGGALGTVFCSGLIGTPGLVTAPSSGPAAFQLGGVTVSVDGAPAPIVAVFIPAAGQSAQGQINFQVPLERNTTFQKGLIDKGTLTLTQSFFGSVAGAATLTPLPPAGGGGFFADASGYAVAQHALDYSTVTLQNPAHAGETIIVYADDFFNVWPPPPVGIPVPPQPLFQSFNLVTLYSIDNGYLYLQDYPTPNGKGQSFTNTPALKTLFQGLAPGMIGVEQINFVVPASQAPGDWALFFNVGSCPDGRGIGCSPIGGQSSPYVKFPVR